MRLSLIHISCLPFLMVLKFDEAFDLILFQIQQVLLTAVAAVGSHRLQRLSLIHIYSRILPLAAEAAEN